MNETLTSRDPIQSGTLAGGKHLAFVLGEETYGIPVIQVTEIIQCHTLAVVPKFSNYSKGVIHLRGKIIPVVDLRAKFGLAPQPSSDLNCIIVVHLARGKKAGLLMGLMVDAVEEVYSQAAADRDETPEFGAAIDTAYLTGMAKIKNKGVLLLNLDRVLEESQVMAKSMDDLITEVAAASKYF